MHENCIPCDGKPEPRPSDLPGMGLVHPVESLKYMRLVLLRDPDPRVLHLHIKLLVVRIQRDMDPSILMVIFNGIFHKV